MWLTMDGHRLLGEEVEVPDTAYIEGAWLLEIFDENRKPLGTEIMYRGTPNDDTALYWLTRYKGSFLRTSRIKIMRDELNDELPFSAREELENDLEWQGYQQYLRNPDDPVFHMDE